MGLLLVSVLVLAHLMVHIRLRKTEDKFLNDSVPANLRGHPNVIAHSLGSYLVARALRDDAPSSVDRIVLAGCVVCRNFPWKTISKKFTAIRNEVAGRDLVPVAAGLLRWRLGDFGRAGRKGFTGDADFAHMVQSPEDCCGICPSQPAAAPVHNFVSAKKGHSGVLKSTYAKYYWLPFFWGIDPSEFREFLDACFTMMKALVDAGSSSASTPGGEFDNLADIFLKRSWGWTGGHTIPEYLAYTHRPVPDAGDQKIIAYNVCHAVIEAETSLGAKVEKWREDKVARQSYKSAQYDEAIKAVNPRTALTRAFCAFKKIPATL